MKRKNSVLMAAVLSVGVVAAFGQVAQAKPHDRDYNYQQDDSQDTREARQEVRAARQRVRQERQDVRNANTPQERRQQQRDVQQARGDVREKRQDLRREKRQDRNGNSYYVDRYYRNGQPYNGSYNGYNYNNGYRPHVNNGYAYNYNNGSRYNNSYGYNRPYTNNGYGYNNGYNYNNSYRSNTNNGYHYNNNGQNRTFEGVVTDDDVNAFTIRTNGGVSLRVHTPRQQLNGVSRGDIVRVYGSTQGYSQGNNVFYAQDVQIVRNR